jgi:hypothetical protein
MCEFISVNRIAFESVKPQEVIFSLNRISVFHLNLLETLMLSMISSFDTNCSFAFGISQSDVSDFFV